MCTLGQVVSRFNWLCHAYCLMDYHLLIETPDGNLSAGMLQLNGVSTQSFNRVHSTPIHPSRYFLKFSACSKISL